MKEIPVGLKGRYECTVSFENTAAALGSGTLPVFGTPFLCSMVEAACLESVIPYLENDEGTVGIKVTIDHLSATPIGMKVWTESELVKADGRKLVFHVKAYDEKGLIGEADHERFVIYSGRFMEKAESKLKD